MEGISHIEALLGLALSSALLWGAIFGFAYTRRQFDEPPQAYLTGFAVVWTGTVVFFVLLALWEAY